MPHRIGAVALREAVERGVAVLRLRGSAPNIEAKRIRVDRDQHTARERTAGKNIGSNGPLLNLTPAIQPRECVFMPH